MAEALKPSADLKNKVNVIPSINRINEATADDFKEIANILQDHALKIDGINRAAEGSKFYGFFTTLPLLVAQFPVAEENGFAVIDPGTGDPQSVASFKNGAWSVPTNQAPIQFYTTKAARDTQVTNPQSGIWYIVLDEKIAYLWHNGGYIGFGKDGNNGMDAYEVAVALGFVGSRQEWIDSIKESLEFTWQGTSLGVRKVGDAEYVFTDLKGPKGDKGEPGAGFEDIPLEAGKLPVTDGQGGTTWRDDNIDNKVDKVAGKGLSTEDYTTAEKNKLAAIDANHYGQPLQSLADLSAIPEAEATDKERRYVEDELSDYFYDVNLAIPGEDRIAPNDQTNGTGFWRKVSAGGDTAASIKTKYESNPDTNAFTDALRDKVNSITAIFTTALKNTYDTAATWVSTNGQNVLDHMTKWTTPATAGKMPRTLADGSIEWIDEPTGGGAGDTTNLAKLDQTNSFQQTQNFLGDVNIGGNGGAYSLQIIKGGANPNYYTFKSNAGQTFGGWQSGFKFQVKDSAGNIYLDALTIHSAGNDLTEIIVRNNLKVNGALTVLGSLKQAFVDLVPNNDVILDRLIWNQIKFSINQIALGATKGVEVLVRNNQSFGWRAVYQITLGDGDSGATNINAIDIRTQGNGTTVTEIKHITKLNKINLSALGEYVDDAAAASAGIPVGYAYINNATGAVHKRRS